MNYTELSDENLVSLTLAGEQDAYAVLVERYQKAVISSAYTIVRNIHMAEDAAQDAFVSAWLKLSSLSDPAKYRVWVCRISLNTAKNMALRMREYLCLDDILEYEYRSGAGAEASLYADEVDTSLRDCISRLPDKVKKVICLHYFEGLSILEISKQMKSPVGTVKWQLHEGRKQLRKELGAMNENENDTLVERVMKKVEELTLWMLRDDKTGYAEEFASVLAEVEALPESKAKDNMVAEMMRQKAWFIDKDACDEETLTRMKKAALASRNDEVMKAVAAGEQNGFSGDALIEFVLNEQLPWYEKEGFTGTVGYLTFWLAYEYFQRNEYDTALMYLDKVTEILPKSDIYHANSISAKEMILRLRDKYSKIEGLEYEMSMMSDQCRIIDGNPRQWTSPGFFDESMEMKIFLKNPINMMFVFGNQADCDSYFLKNDLAYGETYKGTDGSEITRSAERFTVETPCGIFEDCELWTVRDMKNGAFRNVYDTYFKEGVGIVKQTVTEPTANPVLTSAQLLSKYSVSGSGLFPCAEGNVWEYTRMKQDTDEYPFEVNVKLFIDYADDKLINLGECGEILKYPEIT